MPAKKSGCLRGVLALVFTSIVAPVLANLLTQEAATWRQTLSVVLGIEQPAEQPQPAVEEAARPPHAGAWLERPIPVETPPIRRGERSNAVWGR